MRILLVDDNPTTLLFMRRIVETIPGCEPIGFEDPGEVVRNIHRIEFDIAVIDLMMPVYSGLDLLCELKEVGRNKDKPIVFVTSAQDDATRMAALNAGAIDFLTKPINPLEFLARMKNLSALVEARNHLSDRAEWLRLEVDKAVAELRKRDEEIVDRLTLAASYKDAETGNHTRRVGAYSEAIARAYGLDSRTCSDIRLASPMHDIGKVAVPDMVLLKKGRLTEDEFSVIQTHTTVGADILRESKSSLLQLAAEIAACHHEHWDGNGYPSGLAGEAIPVAARIVAVADTFDALTTVRPYKEAWSVEKSIAQIRESAGTQFDPACVKAFDIALATCLALMETDGD